MPDASIYSWERLYYARVLYLVWAHDLLRRCACKEDGSYMCTTR